MNKENFLKVADLIRRNKELFDMGSYGKLFLKDQHVCGSAGCIAGFAAACVPSNEHYVFATAIPRLDQEYLAISTKEANKLFSGKGVWIEHAEELGLEVFEDEDTGSPKIDLSEVTPNQAITVLEKLANGEWQF